MKEKGRVVLVLAVVLLATAALWATLSWAAPGGLLAPPEVIPPVVAYQGEVRVSGSPYTGQGYFKFAVVDGAGATSYWSNDGSSAGGGEPAAAVQLAVSDGLFSVLLGDTALPGMTQEMTADVFGGPDRYLRVWFSVSETGPYEHLVPDTRIVAVPYALEAQEAVNADTVDGLHASQLGGGCQNVVVVAKSGGDYASVQAAMDSISDAAADNAYLVWVAPGVYSETVTMKPYVHLQGAGQEATVITSASSSSDWPPTQATLVLASDMSVRDLTLGHSGTDERNVALLATEGVARALVADVTVRAQGSGTVNFAIYLTGSGTELTLDQVTALGENGSLTNYGLYSQVGAVATLSGGSFTARGGTTALGIVNVTGTTLSADSVAALGEQATDSNHGLYNQDGAVATLRGGSFTGRGGTDAMGIQSLGSGTVLDGEGVTALGESGGSGNIGFANEASATAWLSGGSFRGRGGANAVGIYNHGTDTMLEAESVTALGEDASGATFGLLNFEGSGAMLTGGSFTARGGGSARGIANDGSGSRLGAENVTALGENATDNNYGLRNERAAAARLRGGSYTGRGGMDATGIHNLSSGTIVDAEGAVALGESGSGGNAGLWNQSGAAARLRGGSFGGSSGTNAVGINNEGFGTNLEAHNVTALAQNGSGINFGLINWQGGGARLRGGSFTAMGGDSTRGIANDGSGSTLEAESVVALGAQSSGSNIGLRNERGAGAMLSGGSFTGRGGAEATGIECLGSGSTLEAEGASVLGQGGSSSNTGLSSSGDWARATQSVLAGLEASVSASGSVTISNSRLVDGPATGTVTCVLVTRDGNISTDGTTCP